MIVVDASAAVELILHSDVAPDVEAALVESRPAIAPVHFDAEVYKALRRAYLRVGADLPTFNGTDAWELPMAGTFLVDQSGTVRLAFVDPDFTRRLDPSVMIARLEELQGEMPGEPVVK